MSTARVLHGRGIFAFLPEYGHYAFRTLHSLQANVRRSTGMAAMEATAIVKDDVPTDSSAAACLEKREEGSAASSEIQPEDKVCGICEAVVSERGLLDCCNHLFCFSCIQDWATVTNLCPMCKARFKFLTLVTTGVSEVLSSEDNNGNAGAEKRGYEEPFSYFIDEEAISCLDGDNCKLRMGHVARIDFEDTSVACDRCDRWYHACCVGFDPGKPSGITWVCPRCVVPSTSTCTDIVHSEVSTEEQKITKEVTAPMALSFTETGESAIVISMVSKTEIAREDKAQEEFQFLPTSTSFLSESDQLTDQMTLDKCHKIFDVSVDCELYLGKQEGTSERCTSKCEAEPTLPVLSLDNSNFEELLVSIENSTMTGNKPEDSLQKALEVIPMQEQIQKLADALLGSGSHIQAVDSGRQTLHTETGASERENSSPKQTVSGPDVGHHPVLKNSGISVNSLSYPSAKGIDSRQSCQQNEEEPVNQKSVEEAGQLSPGVPELDPKKPEEFCDIAEEKSEAKSVMEMKDVEGTSEDDLFAISSDVEEAVSDRDSEQGKLIKSLQQKLLEVVEDQENKNLDPSNKLKGDLSKGISSSSNQGAAAVMESKTEVNQGNGVRTRIVIRRDGDGDADGDADARSLAEKIRLEMISAAGYGAAESLGDAAVSDEQFLAAYKAAIAKRAAPKARKAPLDSARENLKRKLYGGIRGRRVWDRDWDVAFWRDRVLSDKRRKSDSKEDSNGKPELLAKLTSGPSDSILERLYVADCSLLPRKDNIRPSTETKEKGSSLTSNASSQNLVKERQTDKSPASMSGKKAANNDKRADGKPEAAVDADGVKDKRQWALELLARKNKQPVKSTQTPSEKGNFVLLPQLPADMRPVLDRNPRSKVPTPVRQMHLNRFLEHYLKGKQVGRNLDCENAITAAVAKENEIYEKSNSKGVYVNLCVRAFQPGAPAKNKSKAASSEISNDAVAQALLATGLVSNSPPGSPVAEQLMENSADGKIKSSSNDGSPRKKMKFTDSAIGKEGITALLEHLSREVEVETVATTQAMEHLSREEKAETKQGTEHISRDEKEETVSTIQEMEHLSREEKLETLVKQEQEAIDSVSPRRDSHSFEPSSSSSDLRKPGKDTPDDLMRDGKFLELENRIERVRSNIVQQLSECNSGRAPSESLPPTNLTSSETILAAKADQTKSKPNTRDTSKDPPIKKQVEMYVKEHIRPLYRSGVIKREQYEWTVNKTTAKVLQHHKDAASADFLITEGGRVKKLAEQYLQRFAKAS